MKIAIIDYQVSNLFSVKHACDAVGITANISSDKKTVSEAEALILPGVGAFGDAMVNLERLELLPVIKEAIAQKKPFLGVCLGMQLLMTESFEFGHHQGLGIIKGAVQKFPSKTQEVDVLKVPQIGWNTIYPTNDSQERWKNSPLKNVEPNEYMYFVHSFYVTPEDSDVILSQTNYNGFEYCSALAKDNIVGFQFHPEKSSQKGIQLYKDWAVSI